MNNIHVTSTGGMTICNMNNSNSVTINTSHMNSHMNSGMISDDISEPSSPESSQFDASDLLRNAVTDDVTAQLAAAGTIGIAAAAAIASSKKRKHPHHFETNPSKRKRQQTRLLRKLKATIDEYTTRVGQQAVVLCCTPGKLSQSVQSFKVFGSQPLENVLRSNRNVVMQELESSLADQAPPTNTENTGLHELPPLVIDGIPTPVDKMTQAQLRNFIPEMLKYSTGRSKPGWGKEESRPIWWPSDLPWANVRSDVRTEEEKKRVSWTDALRNIVKNCYKHHGRDDLLQVFMEEMPNMMQVQSGNNAAAFGGTMVQTINNPDGTVSIIQIETGPQSVVTLPDGTQATVVHAIQQQQQQQQGQHLTQHEATQAVQTLAEVASNQNDLSQALSAHMTPVSLEMNADNTPQLATLPINQNGQIILAGDAQIGGIVTIPVSMYQTMTGGLANLTDTQQTGLIQGTMSQFSTDRLNTLTTKTHSIVPDATQAVEVMTVDQQQVQGPS
ncbi:DNA-binding protein P3A2-like [Argopecten irradians]|uniref:DNA-binding protein P3A2-like n=1 Tax=Argopecten irradians TaxID=31199 RepID=UPI00371C90C2